jgi:hypothetical protein
MLEKLMHMKTICTWADVTSIEWHQDICSQLMPSIRQVKVHSWRKVLHGTMIIIIIIATFMKVGRQITVIDNINEIANWVAWSF